MKKMIMLNNSYRQDLVKLIMKILPLNHQLLENVLVKIKVNNFFILEDNKLFG